MKQKDYFLQSEGDAWLKRNYESLESKKFPDSDRVIMELLDINPKLEQGLSVLEVGCGEGSRLAWLKENMGFECNGVDPSLRAVEIAKEKGINAYHGTADKLPFGSASIDLLIFGSCLIWCDRDDLFSITQEADRVLKNPGWLIIHDFYSPTPSSTPYHHVEGLYSYKMDYSSMFTWHSAYVCMTQKIRHHVDQTLTDLPNEWVATSVIRKCLPK